MTEAKALAVDPTNGEQVRAWDGDEGAYWAENAEHFDRAVAPHHEVLMTAAGIGESERVLDIGCGNGQTTRDAARTAGEGSALGVDLSARMVEHARRLASDAGIANATFAQADVQIHPFTSASFDAAISRTGTMFFGDPKAAFLNIARALRPGGRLVMLVWQGPEPNEWIRELSTALAAGREMLLPPIGAPGPFAQADPDSSATCSPLLGSRTSASKGHRHRCGSAPIPKTRRGSCLASWAGCSTGSMMQGATTPRISSRSSSPTTTTPPA